MGILILTLQYSIPRPIAQLSPLIIPLTPHPSPLAPRPSPLTTHPSTHTPHPTPHTPHPSPFTITTRGQDPSKGVVPDKLISAFQQNARKFSTCPSSKQGGSLGSFGKGQMVPEFDAVVFKEAIGVVHGPVCTTLYYQLYYQRW